MNKTPHKLIVMKLMLGVIASIMLTDSSLSAQPAFAGSTTAPSAVDARPMYMANQVLLQFQTGLAASQRQQKVISLSGARMQAISKSPGFASVLLPADVSVEQAIQHYRKDPAIRHVQPNYIYRSTLLPDDSQFNQQWGLRNSGQNIVDPIYASSNPGVPGRDIDAAEAWDHITDCSAVTVAIVDTGVEYTHQDLAANMWDGSTSGIPNHGWDFVGVSVIDFTNSNIAPDNDPAPIGGSEHHGTHVAAIIGAVGNNALGTSGVCWQVQLMALRALDSVGSGTTLTIRDAIQFAADNGAGIINLSLGFSGPFDQILSDAVDYARDRNVLVVAAAGNGNNNMDATGSNKEYPCALTQDNMLCIAAVDQAFNRAFFSNYGDTSVDLAAPGTNILSAWAGMFMRDNFSSWTLGGGWTRAVNCIITNADALVNPADWCATATPPFPTYANDLDDQATTSYDLSTATAATLLMHAFVDTEINADFFTLNSDATGGSPFDGISDNEVIRETGSQFKNQTQKYEIAINNCRTATCSLGVRLQTDSNDAANEGVGIAQLEILTLQPGGSVIRLLNGTSMATPHVSGVAALVRAMNPAYSAVDTARAILDGGEAVAALAPLTVSGKVVNAPGSLLHINPPTGLSAVEVP